MLRWSCTDFDNILMTVTCFEKSEVSQAESYWPHVFSAASLGAAAERTTWGEGWGRGKKARGDRHSEKCRAGC